MSQQYTAQMLAEIVAAELDAQVLIDLRDGLLVVTHTSAAATKLLRLDVSMLGSVTLQQVLPTSLAEVVAEACATVWRTGKPMNVNDVEWPSAREGKKPRWMDLRIRRLYGRISMKCVEVTALHEATMELRDSQNRYRMLAEYSSDVVFSSRDGVLTWVSPSVRSVLGWKPADMVGRHISEFVHPDDGVKMSGAVAGLEHGQPARYEARFRHRTGRWVWLAITARPEFDDRGRVAGRIGSGRDISSRIAAEDALKASEQELREERELLRSVLDSSLDPQVVLRAVRDDAGVIVDFTFADANNAACGYLRQTRRALLGTSLGSLFPSEAARTTTSWMRRVVETGEPFVMHAGELFPQIAGGQRRMFDISITKLTEGVTFTWRDVTVAYTAATALRESEELFRLTIANSPIALCLIAPDGGFLEVNRALCDLMGRDEATLRRTPWQELTHPEDLDVDLDLVRDVAEGRRDGYRLTKRYLRPDASVVWGELSVSCVREADGTLRHFISQILDITELVQQRQALAESEKHYRLLAENTSDVVTVIDSRGHLEWVSPSVTTAYGWLPEEMVGRPIRDFVEGQDWRRVALVMGSSRPGMHMSGAFRVRRSDGSMSWVGVAATTTTDADGHELRVARVRDIDQEYRAQQRLQRSEERFRTAMNASPVGTALISEGGRLREVNDALCRLTGFASEELLSMNLGELCVDPVPSERACQEVLDRGVTDAREVELRVRNDARVWVQLALAAVTDDDGLRSRLVAQFVDITQARQVRALLDYEANHDPLTELKNRRAVIAQLTATLSHSPRKGSRLAVLYCDLDEFKPVNDTFGHAVGDEVLTEVGRRIARCVRSADTVGRFGGDEFVVLLMEVGDVHDVMAVAVTIGAAVAEPMLLSEQSVRVTVSIGVAMALPGEDPSVVLARADRGLYEAKRQGRDRVVYAE